jgi:hypothetical protein
VSVRKKIRVTLPKWKPEPEPPARLCVLCDETRAGWQFFGDYHPSTCSQCVLYPMPDWRDSYRRDLNNADRGIILSAEAIIRRLRHAA